MIDDFKNYIKENSILMDGDKILLTVSGGIDSMVMLHLFLQTDYEIGIAHCNFRLRGTESDEDQNFVKDFAQKNNLDFYTINFNTLEYAETNKVSIQMAARDLRYKWFLEIASKHAYNKVATAHNLNDIAETFFINLTRGTGIKGLTGIPIANGKIVRPLLFASRKILEVYASKRNIKYREDSSNAETKYLRNAIRHKIIPEFESISNNFLLALEQSTKLLNKTSEIYYQQIGIIKKTLIQKDKNGFRISIKDLTELNPEPEILFDILNEYGFSYDTCINVLKALKSQSGKKFKSDTHELIKDRDYILLAPLKQQSNKEYVITDINNLEQLPIKFKIHNEKWNSKNQISKNTNTAIFDADTLNFPLKLRYWKDGDIFYPYGMKGKKKLSDYFSDNKFSLIEKRNTWILTSEDEIIWIVGHRISDRHKVTKKTKEIIQIEWIG